MAKKNLTSAIQNRTADTNNPVGKFISMPTTTDNGTTPTQELKAERKTKRLQILVKPTLYTNIKAAATSKGISVNEYISQALDIVTNREGGK